MADLSFPEPPGAALTPAPAQEGRRRAPARAGNSSPSVGLVALLLVGALLMGVVGVAGWTFTSAQMKNKQAAAAGKDAGPQVVSGPQGPQIIPAGASNWSDPATWGGQVPAAGADVTIPAGKDVVLNTSPAGLGVLTINGSLTFADADLTLSARAVMVHGALRVGTQEQPFTKKARIVLTGAKSNEDLMGMGTKVIGVMGGTLDLHGQARPTWTRLGATVKRGSSTLQLAKPMPWAVGDQIAVASTDFNSTFTDEFTITGIDGTSVTVNKPAKYTHWGQIQTIAGASVDQRAEVALLSHNVVVEGEQSTSADGFGGQIMVMEGSHARIEAAELTRMGQKSALRRYPLHFHMVGKAPDFYVKNTSIHHTFNRCMTIHGTQDLTVSGNTCYDHIGHGIFFEDSSETGVKLTDNLSFSTRKPEKGQGVLLSDEQSASSFWITNPDNVVTGNIAAGSQGHGFWLAFTKRATGLSAKEATYANLRPSKTPLGTFSANTAHSNSGDGFFVDSAPEQQRDGTSATFTPVQSPLKEKSTPVTAVFDQLRAFKNRNHGVWLRGSSQQVKGAVLSDNGIGATFANDETSLRDSLVIGETENTGSRDSWEPAGEGGRALPLPWETPFPIRGFEFYDGQVAAINTTFANFTPNSVRPASGLGFKLDNEYPTSATNYASGVRFVNALPFYVPDGVAGKDSQRSALFHDQDGSVTGTAGAVVMTKDSFNANQSCALREQWNAAVCPKTSVVGLFVESKANLAALRPTTISRPGASMQLDGAEEDSDSVYANVIANNRYAVSFAGGQTPSKAGFVLRGGVGSWLEVVAPMPSRPTSITLYGCDITAPKQWCYGGNPTSTDDLARSGKPTAYWDESSGQIYVRLVGAEGGYVQLEVTH